MQLVDIEQVQLPEWGWHQEDTQETAKLTASLSQYGQTQSLLVRQVTIVREEFFVRHETDMYEVIDGRRRLSIMKQLDHAFTQVWICNVGAISLQDAIKHALSLELSAGVDYAKMALQIKTLQDRDDFASLPMTTPFSAERLRYFVTLTDFDWSKFSELNEQATFFEDEDIPPPAIKPAAQPQVATVKAAAPVAKKIATVAPQTSGTGPDLTAARRLARAALALPVPEATLPTLQGAHAVEALGIAQETWITFGEDFSGPDIKKDWRPEAPPCLDGIKEIELDCETNGLKWWAGDRPVGMSIRLPDGRKQYLPWAHAGGNLDEETVKRWARTELKGKLITNANSRFDNHMIYAWGVDLEAQGNTWADVQHYAALLDEYRKEVNLDALSRDFLGLQKTGQDLDKTKMAGYHASQVADYACQDVHLVGELKKVMIPLMDAQDLQRVRQLECDVIYPVCEMERNAAYVDKAKIRDAVQESARQLDAILSEIAREVGFQVNSDSNADMVRLFDTLGLAIPGRTAPTLKFPTGQPSFADALLERVDHPLVQMVRRSGKLSSLRSKFLVPYAKLVGDDNKLRFALHQLRGDEYGTARGRFSMSGASKGIGQFGANLQQVFRVNSQRMAFGFAHDDSSHDHEIFLVRAFFEAEPYTDPETGWIAEYISADAQSIEYRLAAHFAEAGKLIDAYKADTKQLAEGRLTDKWVDFHKVVGDEIRVYKDLSRNIVKNANFCLVYGGQKETLSATLGMDRKESDQIYHLWHRMFPELSKLPSKAEKIARSRGFVKTILGRRARFKNEEELKWAHASVNYVIQGSAADIMKTKLVELHKERKYTGLLMRQTVHDEADGDARKRETAQRVREILNRQSFPELKVPIVWEVETGKNWAVAH